MQFNQSTFIRRIQFCHLVRTISFPLLPVDFTVNNLKATTLTSSSLTSNSVIITWAPPSDSSQVSSYNVLWRVNGSSPVDGNLTVGNAVSTANITGLTQGTSYVFSVVSEERGSRAITQEIESDETVTITTSTFTCYRMTLYIFKCIEQKRQRTVFYKMHLLIDLGLQVIFTRHDIINDCDRN
ncbi:Chitinase A1 [invertebrate metagenome]|uniref:Chitinase A1 n=1 Tax=invertebrate metagenome TaxID=1711999 RepID=A0A2H9T2I4_9ZZZZ